jgi:hypothetical protein
MDQHIFYTKKGDKQIRNGKYVLLTYKNIPRDIQFKHPTINDYNQLLCGGFCFLPDIEFEEVDRVVLGLKPVGISSTRELQKAQDKTKEIINKGFLCSFEKSKFNEFYFVTASPKGKLKDFFPDLEILAQDYERHNLKFWANIIRDCKELDFKVFHDNYNPDESPTCITGLILGYPIENTISLIHMHERGYLLRKLRDRY